MIAAVDNVLRDWAKGLVDEAEVSLSAPDDADGKRVVSVYLMDVLPAPRVSGSRRLPLQACLRYVVTASAESVEAGHQLLCALLFAAMEHPEYEIELAQQPASLWRAFGVRPRPSFMLRVPVRVERPEPRIGRIRHAAEVRVSPMESLCGLLLGPGGLPLSQAHIELPSLQFSTRTDAKGRFRFPAVSSEPEARELRVRFKGHERRVEVENGVGRASPLIIHFDTMEV